MNGILLVDKPSGPTSHDVVAVARRRLGTRRVGHAGTLDPLASGLLVLGVGKATRLLRWLEHQSKVYEVRARFGVLTDTGDRTGRVLERDPAPRIDRERLCATLERFVPGYEQVPPAYSAVHVGGRRAYEVARCGETVELSARWVRIDVLELVALGEDAAGPWATLRVRCGPGTYVRSLVVDLARSLGTLATVDELRRTAVGALSVDDAVEPEAIAGATPVELTRALAALEVVELGPEDASRFAHGGLVEGAGAEGTEVLVRASEHWLGVARYAQGWLRPLVVLVETEGSQR